MKTTRNVIQVDGYCDEQDWGEYSITLERNKLSELRIDMPAIVSRAGGRHTIPYLVQATTSGWHLYSHHHSDRVTFNVDMTEGHYHYYDDRPCRLHVEWDCDFDWEKFIGNLHKKLLSNNGNSRKHKRAA